MSVLIKRVVKIFILVFVFMAFNALFFGDSKAPQLKDGDVVYQAFEVLVKSKAGSNVWAWDKSDSVRLSEKDEPVFEGNHSLRFDIPKWPKYKGDGPFWRGFGMQSESMMWNVDLNPDGTNTKLVLWIYALPSNGGTNNLNIQFYDNGNHSSDDTKVEFWTKAKAKYGQWTMIEITFESLLKKAPDLDLNNINKLQFQQYWPGTYYIDYIIATK